jgi:hypothetical protein
MSADVTQYTLIIVPRGSRYILERRVLATPSETFAIIKSYQRLLKNSSKRFKTLWHRVADLKENDQCAMSPNKLTRLLAVTL